jgi:hypothetical protein
MRALCFSLSAFAGLLFAPPSFAQPTDDKPEAAPAVEPAAPPTVKAAEPPPDPGKYDPIEKPHTAYRFIGVRFRDVIVPKFMVNIFADGGSTVNVAMFGPEFTTRKDRLEFDFAIQYADYSMQTFMFKGKSETDEAYEKVGSSMKLLYFTMDILYEIPIDDTGRFSFLVGGGVGIAPVFGSLYRAQAVPKNGRRTASPDDESQWDYCRRPPPRGSPEGTPGTPRTRTPAGQPYCDGSNDHYGRNHTEPSWANGGSKPSIFPWISLPQLSFRYKPIKQLQTRFDTGFSITGFFFGLSAGYGL